MSTKTSDIDPEAERRQRLAAKLQRVERERLAMPPPPKRRDMPRSPAVTKPAQPQAAPTKPEQREDRPVETPRARELPPLPTPALVRPASPAPAEASGPPKREILPIPAPTPVPRRELPPLPTVPIPTRAMPTTSFGPTPTSGRRLPETPSTPQMPAVPVRTSEERESRRLPIEPGRSATTSRGNESSKDIQENTKALRDLITTLKDAKKAVRPEQQRHAPRRDER